MEIIKGSAMLYIFSYFIDNHGGFAKLIRGRITRVLSVGK